MKKYSLVIAIICSLMLSVGLLTGCATEESNVDTKPHKSVNNEHAKDKATSSTNNKNEQRKLDINLYFPDEQGMKLQAVKYSVVDNDNKYKTVLEALVNPKDKQLTIIPRKTKINKVNLKGDILIIDFSKQLIDNFGGGSTGEEMLVGSIVNTATEFPEVKKVQIFVDGKSVETIAGHLDLSEPLARMGKLIQ